MSVSLILRHEMSSSSNCCGDEDSRNGSDDEESRNVDSTVFSESLFLVCCLSMKEDIPGILTLRIETSNASNSSDSAASINFVCRGESGGDSCVIVLWCRGNFEVVSGDLLVPPN